MTDPAIEWWTKPVFLSVWVPLAAVVIGGGITLVTSYVATRHAHRLQQKAADVQRRVEQAEAAFSGLAKLMSAIDEIGTLRKHIADAIADADKQGVSPENVSGKVLSIVGYDAPEDPLLPKELRFLIHHGEEKLYSAATLIQRKAWTNRRVIHQYNQLRGKFEEFLESNLSGAMVSGENLVTTALSGDAAKHGQLLVVSMDKLLEDLIGHLETDQPEALRIAQEYNRAASEFFGDAFPRVKVELSPYLCEQSDKER